MNLRIHTGARARRFRCGGGWLISVLLLTSVASAQRDRDSVTGPPDTRQLLLELRDELRQTRADLANAQHEIQSLSGEVASLRRDLTSRRSTGSATAPGFASPADNTSAQRTEEASGGQPPDGLSENEKLLKAQIEEQQQTKVESGSKYRVKLSGLVLMNAFSNRGAVDKVDVPNRAVSSQDKGSVGATLRQSIFGLQVFGPELAGARTSGNISVDFFGGLAQQPYGETAGILRLRTASAHLDGPNTSIMFGQEAPFISPLSPTSYATLAEPALAWSGNLWVWTPQVVAEHRFHSSDDSFFLVSGGVLAPLTEDIPTDDVLDRAQASPPSPGERGRRPAIGSRLGWQSRAFRQTLQFGVGAYTSHLRYNFGRATESWAVTSYWQVPLNSRVELSGEAYRGRAVGGLGGGIAQSVVYAGDPLLSTTGFRPLNAGGGWVQLKIRLHPKWETNGAFGQDNVLAGDLRWAPTLQGEYMTPLARNRTAFGNVIFHPKSDLVLSAEYRKIWTYGYIGRPNTADQVNLGAGVSF